MMKLTQRGGGSQANERKKDDGMSQGKDQETVGGTEAKKGKGENPSNLWSFLYTDKMPEIL